MADKASQFVLVMSVNPHRDGGFTRAGIRFSRAWRELELGDADDREKGVIGPETLAKLKAEPFLALRPATAEEVALLAADRATAPADKDAELSALRAKNADLEARLLRLELAAGGDKTGGKTKVEQPKG